MSVFLLFVFVLNGNELGGDMMQWWHKVLECPACLILLEILNEIEISYTYGSLHKQITKRDGA